MYSQDNTMQPAPASLLERVSFLEAEIQNLHKMIAENFGQSNTRIGNLEHILGTARIPSVGSGSGGMTGGLR